MRLLRQVFTSVRNAMRGLAFGMRTRSSTNMGITISQSSTSSCWPRDEKMFDAHGHIELPPDRFYELLGEKSDDVIINNYLMVGTPRVFSTYDKYCSFTRNLGSALGVHERSFIVRGSAHLGYSISPKPDKAWRVLDDRSDGKVSDIDVAIVDAEYFDRMDFEIRAWEDRQRRPEANSANANKFLDRERARAFGCIKHFLIPPLTCVWHNGHCQKFSTEEYCEKKRPLSAFVFRSWHALLSHWRRDLQDLRKGLKVRRLPRPGEDLGEGPMNVTTASEGGEAAQQGAAPDAASRRG